MWINPVFSKAALTRYPNVPQNRPSLNTGTTDTTGVDFHPDYGKDSALEARDAMGIEVLRLPVRSGSRGFVLALACEEDWRT